MSKLPYKFEKCPICGSVKLKISTPELTFQMIGVCQCEGCGFHVSTMSEHGDEAIPYTFSTKFHARKAVRLIWNSIAKDFPNLSDYQEQCIRTKETVKC